MCTLLHIAGGSKCSPGASEFTRTCGQRSSTEAREAAHVARRRAGTRGSARARAGGRPAGRAGGEGPASRTRPRKKRARKQGA
jgi:hypothetical protein